MNPLSGIAVSLQTELTLHASDGALELFADSLSVAPHTRRDVIPAQASGAQFGQSPFLGGHATKEFPDQFGSGHDFAGAVATVSHGVQRHRAVQEAGAKTGFADLVHEPSPSHW